MSSGPIGQRTPGPKGGSNSDPDRLQTVTLHSPLVLREQVVNASFPSPHSHAILLAILTPTAR